MKWWQKLSDRLHLLLMLPTVFLVLTSPWIFMARQLPANASFWNLSHVYLGLLTCLLGILFLLTNLMGGTWRQYFPWVVADINPLVKDIVNFAKLKLPVAGGRGLFSVIEGLTMLDLVATGLTGVAWYLTQGTADALSWRAWHIDCAQWFIGLLIVHMVCALSHLLDFLRQ
ncbi:MAG: cytochrome b/b6 domain-containing protein [Shewanella sp.]|nr:cytochrome b/b6 domain-containing protein [Shewanella sp.]MCF1430958.1 cytochrome b/b6 domain-containing protein [Shewanella sp.]MCF1438976.1 cytochrome b/b6 domain-containing protein [Shewanella sp.]MCF1458122.1 cytochrome b/b6 domain-containing protein [Shewanella sp.]